MSQPSSSSSSSFPFSSKPAASRGGGGGGGGSGTRGGEQPAAVGAFNVEDLREEFERECDGGAGSPGACFSLGEWHQVVARDFATARAIYEKNCGARDNANSCFNLAVLVAQGAGGDKDEPRARELLETACRFGHARACDTHGQTCLREAQRRAKTLTSASAAAAVADVAEARQSLAKACAKDYAPSCFRLGHMYRIGQLSADGKTADHVAAFKFMKRTCDLGMASGCKNLAVMYRRGDGMDRPDEKKFQYYAKMTRDIARATGERMGVEVSGLK
jgi:TPR repeat protein